MLRNPWTQFFDWYKAWTKDLATTSHIIVHGVALAAIYVLWVLAADTFCRALLAKYCSPVQPTTQETLAWFLMGMLVGGVGQFGVKRMTDRETIAAKAEAKEKVARATTMMPAVKDPS